MPYVMGRTGVWTCSCRDKREGEWGRDGKREGESESEKTKTAWPSPCYSALFKICFPQATTHVNLCHIQERIHLLQGHALAARYSYSVTSSPPPAPLKASPWSTPHPRAPANEPVLGNWFSCAPCYHHLRAEMKTGLVPRGHCSVRPLRVISLSLWL